MKYDRKKIEEEWVYQYYSEEGEELCIFLYDYPLFYEIFEDKVWGFDIYSPVRPSSNRRFSGRSVYIKDTFKHIPEKEEVYLLRALTLNMLLDDNEHLLE